MLIQPKFKIEAIVYLITDVEQKPRMVTGYTVRKDGMLYILASGSSESDHSDFEISDQVTY